MKAKKAKKVECDWCKNFIPAILKDEGNLISPIIKKAQCKLGKRVMFRMPIPVWSFNPDYYGGYIRYCNDFKYIENE